MTYGTITSKCVSLDGIEFWLLVIRDEAGTETLVEACESRPGYPANGGSAWITLHTEPFDPDL